MNTMIRKTAIAGAAAIAMVATGSIAAPSEAHANGKAVAAFVGGALLGGFLASQTPVYAAPVYAAPVYYGPTCTWQKQQVVNPYTGLWTWQNVKVCY
jgi:hypothetical protein